MKQSHLKFLQKVVGEGGLRLLSTAFILLLARKLGAEEFGRYSTAMAYAALCVVLVDLGINSIVTREIARHPEDRIHIAEVTHTIKVAASLCSWLGLLALTYVLHFASEARYLTLCLGIVVIGQGLMDYFSALLSGIEEMGWEALLKVISRALALSFGFFALARQLSLHDIVTYMAMGTFCSYAVSVWILHHRFSSFGFNFDNAFTKIILKASVPILASVIFWVVYDAQDVLLLNYFKFSLTDIGYFSAAMKIMDVLRVYPILLIGVFFPTLSKLHITDQPAFEKKRQRITLFLTLTLSLIAASGWLLSPWVIRALYAKDFLPASRLLRLLMPSLVIMGLNHAHTLLLIARNREHKLMTGAVLLSVSNLIIASFLLPHFGVPGSCYALFGSEAIYFLFVRNAMKPGL